MRSLLEEGLRALETEKVETLSGAELGASIEEERKAIDRLEADCSRRLARFVALRGFEANGALDPVAWLKQHGRLSGGAAAERVRVASKLADLPIMATAFSTGRISFGQAAVVARAAGDVGPEAVAELERRTVEAAQQLDPSGLRQFAERLSCELNQEAFLADQNRAHERRRLDYGQGPDGMWIIDGRLDQEGGAYLSTALDAVLGPRSKDDGRTPAQRRADALVDLSRRVLEEAREDEPTVRGIGGQRPHLTVTATIQALRGEPGAPAGELIGRYPVASETVQRIACDAALTPMVVDETGDPLDFGRTMRTASPPLRRAVVLSDKRCRFPGCDRSASWCDVHHLDDWARGGRTRKKDLLLVCRPHHRLLHEGGWKLLRDSDGEVVAVPP
ncbi:MAG TPA: DUF222 domain-containing protein [Candidatus Solibacter sp.]|jgi:hypothetical protein|nr:DUF222 domain-containing protein [Candidatus Solibacter sp.]